MSLTAAADPAPSGVSMKSLDVRSGERGWLITVAVIALIVSAPLISMVVLALGPSNGLWPHLIANVLPRASWTTIELMIGVGLLTISIGVVSAWLVTMCVFPGRQVLDWLLLAPLAVPTYIVAYAYADLLDVTGPIQTAVRYSFGFTSARDYWFPEIRSLGGAAFVMGFVLYPYVYLTTRAMFLMQSACLLDVSRTLGAGPLRLFFRVAVPLARPAIAVGATLVLMETLNDIGAVEFLGVNTLTFSVYDTWLNRGSLSGAAQIATVLLAIVIGLIWLERYARRHQRYHLTTSRYRSLPSYRLAGWRAWLALGACTMPVLLGFVVPALVLVDQTLRRLDLIATSKFLGAIGNSLGLAVAAACVTVILGTIMAYAVRTQKSRLVSAFTRVASIGYAIPGTVLAVGILVPLAALDNAVDLAMRGVFGISTGLLISASGLALVYAYAVRFLTVSFGSIDTGLTKISPSLDMAARALGRGTFATLREVHLPLLKPILLSAALLVFVDCMKELPATILLRPFNFDTLSTLVYEAASLEAFEDGAPAALAIVLVGLLPVIALARMSALSFRSVAKEPTAP